MAGHAQLKFVMTECSKTQIRLTGPNSSSQWLQEEIKVYGCTLTLFMDYIKKKKKKKKIKYKIQQTPRNSQQKKLPAV